MNERPKLTLELYTIDKILEILGWVAIIFIWGLTGSCYAALPGTIPVHYNYLGEADNFGDKGNFLILPVVATILFTGLTILNKFPHIFNYPVKITSDNALRQYTIATRLIRYIRLITTSVFCLIVLQTMRTANGQAGGTGSWFLPLTLGLIFIPLLYYVVKAMNSVKHK